MHCGAEVGLAIVEAVVVYVVNKKSLGGICVFGRAMSVEMCVTTIPKLETTTHHLTVLDSKTLCFGTGLF